ncbi:hypothetical protein K492DRAFT_238377 [Lichtheimia hyalospora FSU 10163]|nr:hypothetical protein K492DRAFT_238377 [Lichtheimia hyalospora FSU 10163]
MYYPSQQQQQQPGSMPPSSSQSTAMPRHSSPTSAPGAPPLLALYPKSGQSIVNTVPPPDSLQRDNRTPQKRPRKERACDRCRRKKIRCDYSQAHAELPCSSCRSYGTMCTFNEAARKRGPSKGYVEALENRLQRMEAILANLASSGNASAETVQQLLEDEKAKTTSPSSSTEEEQSSQHYQQQQSSSSSSKHGQPLVPDYSYFGSSSGIYLVTKYFPDLVQQGKPHFLSITGGDVMINREDFDDEITSALPNYRQWTLPPKEVVDKLVELFFSRMNKLLPVLDEEEFLANYRKGYDAVYMPLLVAICRGASRLLTDDDPVVKKYGIDRRQLLISLNKQYNHNCNIDMLTPKIENAQVLLVMAYSAEKWAPESEDWMSASLAVKMAQDLGLHRSRTQQQMPPHLIEPYKRLWWSAYVMDRWICAALGRPLIISDADCDIELPAVDHHGNNYEYLIQLTKLSGILGDVLRILYAPRARLVGNLQGMGHICNNLDRALADWQNGLPADLKLSDKDIQMVVQESLSDDLSKRLNNGAGQLRLVYNSVLLLMRLPFFCNGSNGHLSTEVLNASREVMYIVKALDIQSLITVSWTLMGHVFLQTLCILLLCRRDSNPAIASGASHLLTICKDQCRRLEPYIPERSLVSFVELLEKIIVEDRINKAPLVVPENSVNQEDVDDSSSIST